MSATARSTQETSSLIRSTVDEVREVAPGSNLGPATMVKGKPKPILFFAVSFQQQRSVIRPTNSVRTSGGRLHRR